MANPTNALFGALLQQVAIPEILAVIRAHFNATGKLPTDADVIAALSSDTTSGISTGQAWLAAHPES